MLYISYGRISEDKAMSKPADTEMGKVIGDKEEGGEEGYKSNKGITSKGTRSYPTGLRYLVSRT